MTRVSIGVFMYPFYRAYSCLMKRILPLTLLFLSASHSCLDRQEERIGIRLIAVQTEAEAASLRAQIQKGVPFEALAKAHSTDASAKVGGYLGFLHLADLKPEFQRALDGLAPGRTSTVTQVGGEFLLLQRLSLEEGNWILSNEAGLQAFSEAAMTKLRRVSSRL